MTARKGLICRRLSLRCHSLAYIYLFNLVPGTSLGMDVASDNSFKSIEGQISDLTYKGILDMGFTQMTEVQAKAIPHLLEGRLVKFLKIISFRNMPKSFPCFSMRIIDFQT